MKKLLAAALLCGAALPAHATQFQCSGFHQATGYAGRNPPETAVISHEGGYWSVHYVLHDGMTVERRQQFDVTDATNANDIQWTGRFNKNPSKWMLGQLRRQISNGHMLYIEYLYDNKNTLLASSWIDCGMDGSQPTPTYNPPVVAQAPAPAPTYAPSTEGGDRVPFIYAQGGMHVPVSLSGYPATMVIDTGATAMTITETLANQLVSNGQATYPGEVVEVTLADNSKRSVREISINTLTVGGRSIQNVHGHVAPDGSDMLLGITVLARLSPKFSINTAANTLDLD